MLFLATTATLQYTGIATTTHSRHSSYPLNTFVFLYISKKLHTCEPSLTLLVWTGLCEHFLALVTCHLSLATYYFPTQKREKISVTSSSLVSFASIISSSLRAFSRVKQTMSEVSPRLRASLA